MAGNGKDLGQIHLDYEAWLLVCWFVCFILPCTYLSTYFSPSRLSVTANSVAVPDSATEQGKNKPDSHLPSGTSPRGGPWCVFANTVLDFKSWRAWVCLQLAFVFLNIFTARCPCHQRNIPWARRFEIQNIWHTCALIRRKHILTRKKTDFSTTSLNWGFFNCLVQPCSDRQAFQKPDEIRAQLNYFILGSVSFPGSEQ